MEMVQWSDMDFSNYLRMFGKWTVKQVVKGSAAISEFYSEDGTIVAVVFYNNSESRHWIYI